MKEGWTFLNFEDCIEKSKKTKQLKTSDYLPEGKYPIVSQESDLISGYTNMADYVNDFGKPIVVFGDHSRVVKYIDFAFAVGADGVKILIPTNDFYPKFFYYYLHWHGVENLGYSRHYKLLKEINVPLPSLSEQQHIVEELDLLSSIIEKKKAQLNELDNLAQSLFYEMFGDPITNEMGWIVKPLKENVIEMFLGPFGSALKVDSYVDKKDSYCMVYEQKHAIQGTIELDAHYITKDKYNSLKRFEVCAGDFIMSCRGTIGRILQLPPNAPIGIIHPSLMKIRINNNIYSPIYFRNMLVRIVSNERTNGNCVQMAITAKELGKKQLPVPPFSIQQQFASKIEAIEHQKELIKQSIKEVETLLNSRMDYYFN